VLAAQPILQRLTLLLQVILTGCAHACRLRLLAGDRLVEAQHINKSLSALGDVMAALASKDRHIPYRNSKLTQLLQDSLQGQAKVMMFMHVSPEANMYGESVSTLKFAARVSEITLGQVGRTWRLWSRVGLT
jgi:hypothetical protein